MNTELEEVIKLAGNYARAVYQRYGLEYQGVDRSWQEDMRQAALLRYLEGGNNSRQAVWRGVMEQVRLAIFGGEEKRSIRPTCMSIQETDASLSHDREIEAQRILERIQEGTVPYSYFNLDKTLGDIGKELGITESAVSQRWRTWARKEKLI